MSDRFSFSSRKRKPTLRNEGQMRKPKIVALGLAVGLVFGFVGAWSVGPALSEGTERSIAETLQVHHKQPSLVDRSKPLELVYDTICPWDEEAFMKNVASECKPTGDIFVRSEGSEVLQVYTLNPVEGTPFLTATLPSEVTSHSFTYFAEVRDEGSGSELVRIPDDPRTFHRAFPLDDSFDVMLENPKAFDQPDATVVRGSWGGEMSQFGLTGGNESGLDGPSAFGFDTDGSLVVLDQVNGRLIDFNLLGGVDGAVTIDHSGSLGDLAVGSDGVRYVMDDSARADARVVALTPEGHSLVTAAPPALLPEKMSIVDGKLFILDAIRGSWSAAMDGGEVVVTEMRSNGLPLETAQRTAVLDKMNLSGAGNPGELVAWADANEAKFALVDGTRVIRSWRVSSERQIGEIQLALISDGALLVVLRTWNDTNSAFEILRLSDSELLDHRVVETGDWAQSSVLGRFELNTRGELFQLRSSPDGFSIVRFDFGGGK